MERRKLLKIAAGTSAALGVGGVASYAVLDRVLNPKTPLNYTLPHATGGGDKLRPTPVCGAQAEATQAQTEGPFYTPNTPHRNSLLEADTVGKPLLLNGYVVNTLCEPLPGAVLDFWSCDGNGVYDNEGMKLRGHQFADANGYYQLETIRPANYNAGPFAMRTAHIHVKVQGQNTPLLTTQLYFPDNPQNEKDGIFHPALLVDVTRDTPEKLEAFFLFVLA